MNFFYDLLLKSNPDVIVNVKFQYPDFMKKPRLQDGASTLNGLIFSKPAL